MGIGPIGGPTAAVTPATARPESMEAPGMPDRDHDSDDSPANAVAAAASPAQRGRLDVKA